MRRLSAHGVSAGHAGGKERERLAGGERAGSGRASPHEEGEEGGVPSLPRSGRTRKEEAHSADTMVEEYKFWLSEGVNVMMAMDTNSMFRKRSNYFFSCSGERATFATTSERDLCPGEVVLLLWSRCISHAENFVIRMLLIFGSGRCWLSFCMFQSSV